MFRLCLSTRFFFASGRLLLLRLLSLVILAKSSSDSIFAFVFSDIDFLLLLKTSGVTQYSPSG